MSLVGSQNSSKGRRLIAFKANASPIVLIALALVAMAALVTVFTPLIAPYGYNDQSLLHRLVPPLSEMRGKFHLLGTDELGRDVFSRVLYALRTSMMIGVAGTFIGMVVGTTLGVLAAHFRGLVEDAVSLAVDVQLAVPFMLMALAALAYFGNSLPLFICLLGLYGWENYTRLARGLVLTANEQGYVDATLGLGYHPLRVYLGHVLPNILGPLMVQVTLSFPAIILMESSLSFLGLGVQQPLASLGSMIGTGRQILTTAWWVAVFPGVVIFLMAVSISVIGDWLRDSFDPTSG